MGSRRSGANVSGRSEPDLPRPLDMDELDGEASELSWGYGLTPKGLENAPPSFGGRYKGREATFDDPPDRIVQLSRDRRI
jgi:hypothetical protein